MTPEEHGRRGGEATRDRHGSAHYSAIGKKGAHSRHKTQEKGRGLFLTVSVALMAELETEAEQRGLTVQDVARGRLKR